MSEESTETTEVVAEPTKAERIEQAWAASQSEAAPDETITAEKLDEKPTERVSTAPSIREFIKAQKGEAPGPTSALETEISELRAALDHLRQGGVEEKPQTREEAVLAKLEALEAREAQRVDADKEAREEEEFNQRVAALREGAIENINARAEDYPGLVALEQQETVVNALFQRLEEGTETSEDEIASEVEDGLKEVYEKLHKVYGSVSKDPAPVSERPKTLNPSLVGADAPVDMSKMTRKERIDAIWATHNQQ